MFENLPNIAFDPLLSVFWITALGILMFIAALAAGMGKLRSYFLRLLAGLFIVLALLNPQTVIEDREPLQDAVLVIKDESESMTLGQRAEASAKTYTALLEKLKADPTLDVTTTLIRPNSDGTRLTSSLIDGLSNMPANRLAGVIAITDGQIHDLQNPLKAFCLKVFHFIASSLEKKTHAIDASAPSSHRATVLSENRPNLNSASMTPDMKVSGLISR